VFPPCKNTISKNKIALYGQAVAQCWLTTRKNVQKFTAISSMRGTGSPPYQNLFINTDNIHIQQGKG